MMTFHKEVSGICACAIDIDVTPDLRVIDIHLTGGCDGGGKTMSRLCSGQTVDWCISRLMGICCGRKNTSCANEVVTFLYEIQKGK